MDLKCYPICECGHIFKDLVSDTHYVEIDENHSKWERRYNPSECPNCGEENKNIVENMKQVKNLYNGFIMMITYRINK